MYEEHFGFREPPFRITPDPRFLYRNPCVEEAAAALAYGIERRKGFLSLVGEAGTGKTTLLRHVLDTLAGNVRTVVLLHPTVEFDEILEYIERGSASRLTAPEARPAAAALHEFLVEHTRGGSSVALLIDEAQDLEARVLEELRLLEPRDGHREDPADRPSQASPSSRQARRQLAPPARSGSRCTSGSTRLARGGRRLHPPALQLAGATTADVFTPPPPSASPPSRRAFRAS
jgi:hypothetical protein